MFAQQCKICNNVLHGLKIISLLPSGYADNLLKRSTSVYFQCFHIP